MSIWEEIFMLAQLKHKTKELGLHSFAPGLDFLHLRSNAKAISLTSSWTTAEAENWLHNLRGDRGCQRRVLLSLSATSADTLGVIAAAPSLLGLGSQSVNRSLSVISLGHSQLPPASGTPPASPCMGNTPEPTDRSWTL